MHFWTVVTFKARIQFVIWILISTFLSVASEAPRFVYSPPKYLTGRQNYTVVLSCVASGTPVPTLTWYRDGVEVKPTSRVSLTGNNLQIENLQYSDAGRYKCQFTNVHGSVSYTAILLIEGGVFITDPPRNQSVISGQSVTFECSSISWQHNPTYTWYKDGENINVFPRLRQRVVLSTNGSLTIHSAGENDSGVYKCTVRNDINSFMSAEAHLRVLFIPLVDVTRWQGTFYITVGSNAELPCPVQGYPPATHVVWTVAERHLDHNSTRIEQLEDFSLLIHNVTFDDSGSYTCTPYNMNGPGQWGQMAVIVWD